MLLRRRHGAQRESLARLGNEMPVKALLVLELERGESALLGCQRSQERPGRLAHDGRGMGPVIGGGEEYDSHCDSTDSGHRQGLLHLSLTQPWGQPFAPPAREVD